MLTCFGFWGSISLCDKIIFLLHLFTVLWNIFQLCLLFLIVNFSNLGHLLPKNTLLTTVIILGCGSILLTGVVQTFMHKWWIRISMQVNMVVQQTLCIVLLCVSSVIYYSIKCSTVIINIVNVKITHSRSCNTNLLNYLPTYLLTYSLTHSLTHSLTPWRRVLLEKLTGYICS